MFSHGIVNWNVRKPLGIVLEQSLKSNKKLIQDNGDDHDDDPRNIIAEYVLACTTGAFGENSNHDTLLRRESIAQERINALQCDSRVPLHK